MILSCGEVLVDMIPFRTGDGEDAYLPRTGGAALNTAIALGRLGVEIGLLTGLSTDIHGQMLDRAIGAAGIDTRFCVRSAKATTLAFVSLRDGHASYTFHDENTAGRMVRLEDFPPLPASIAALLCGGISLVAEPCGETYAGLVAREHGRFPIMCDPNIRPGFIADEARYRDRLLRILKRSDIIKVSDEDLLWLVPEDMPMAERVGRLPTAGLIVVTEGGRGATAFCQDGSTITVPAKPAKVADTVGAGDTFNAGLLAHLSQTGDLRNGGLKRIGADQIRPALQFAHELAAITVSRVGADPPWASQVSHIWPPKRPVTL